jgi:hypothetical protein
MGGQSELIGIWFLPLLEIAASRSLKIYSLSQKIVFSADDRSQAGRKHETQSFSARTSLGKASKPAESL